MRRKMTAVVIAVFVFSLIAASAATLGGINSAEIGADQDVVAACTTGGVDLEFTHVYDSTAGEFVVNTVTVTISDLDGSCDGETVSVVLANDASSSSWESTEVTATISSDSATLDFSSQALSANETGYAHVAIS